MGEQLFLERFLWFDAEAKKNNFPNASNLARQFECSIKTAQRSIEFFRCRLHAPLEYNSTRKGFYYVDPTFQLPVMRLNEKELLSLLISKKLLSDAAAGPLGDELGSIAGKLGAVLSENVPRHTDPDRAFSFRSSEVTPANPLLFECISNALLMFRLLTFNYYSPAGNRTTTRTVEPHHLVNYMGAWHLIAFCRMRNDWRDFHRASHEAEIMMEILRHGSEVEALEPDWLREKVKKEIKKMTKKYRT